MAFDFHEKYRNPNLVLGDDILRQVVHNNCFSVDNMDDRELREAIVHDLLFVTMWEIQTGESLHFGFTSFFRFILRSQRKRINEQMKHEEISGLITHCDQLRIKNQPEILQAAMNYTGVWYSGFKMPTGASIVNREALDKAIEAHGGVEQIVVSLMMDISTTVAIQETKKFLN